MQAKQTTNSNIELPVIEDKSKRTFIENCCIVFR